MTGARIPGRTWDRRRTALVLLVLAVPAVALGAFAPGGSGPGLHPARHVVDMARFASVISSAAALVSAVATYAAWRINPRPGLAWTSFAVTMLGCQGLVPAVAGLGPSSTYARDVWLLAGDLTVAVAVACCALLTERVPLRPDPLGAGFLVGTGVAMLRLFWITREPTLGADVPVVVVTVVFAVAFVAAAVLVLRLASLPGWARPRLALAVLLTGAAHLALYLGDSGPCGLAALAGYTLGSAALVTTSLALFLLEVEVEETSRSNLHDQLEHARQASRGHRAQFHEVNSTVAGIASASRLLRSAQPINAQRRRALDDMIFAELSRLERLLARSVTLPKPRTVDLDETIGTVVVSHEARGHEVHWTPSGERVTAHPDAVAEVINILLDNAAAHGRSRAEVSVARRDGALEIVVHDDGPGIDRLVRRRIFAWGAHGPASNGQGIGLHIAQELMEQQGGYLEVRDGTAGGATFVMGLPLGRGADGPTGPDGDEAADAGDPA